MKIAKKIIVITVVVLLCAAVFAGCGKKASSDQDVYHNDEQKAYEPYEFVGSPTDEYGNQGEIFDDGTNIDDELLTVESNEEERDLSDASEEDAWSEIVQEEEYF